MEKRLAHADVSLCKGCRLCVGVCPVKAIIPLTEINNKGYPIIKIDTEKCIGCGNCYRMCPDYVFEVR
ncbi:MAG: 4Fe-4S binding protein [Oscillospiraceae bacterium]